MLYINHSEIKLHVHVHPPPPHTHSQVRTQLAHPTNYHMTEVQRKQVQQFLSQHGTPVQTRSAPTHNLTGFGMPRGASLGGGAQKDPLLSGAMGASGSSPLKPNSFNPTMGSPIKHSPVNPCEWKYIHVHVHIIYMHIDIYVVHCTCSHISHAASAC